MTMTSLGDEFPYEARRLSDAAFRTHTEALVWSSTRLLDLAIPKGDLLRFAYSDGAVVAAEELLRAGWWKDCGDYWHIGERFAEWQQTKQQVERRRETNKRNQAHRRGDHKHCLGDLACGLSQADTSDDSHDESAPTRGREGKDSLEEAASADPAAQPSSRGSGGESAGDPKDGALSALIAGYKHRHPEASTAWQLNPKKEAPFLAAIEKRGLTAVLEALDRHVAAHGGQPPGHAVAFIPTMKDAARESAAEKRYANQTCEMHGQQMPCTPCVQAQAAPSPPTDLLAQTRAGLMRARGSRPDVRDAA